MRRQTITSSKQSLLLIDFGLVAAAVPLVPVVEPNANAVH